MSFGPCLCGDTACPSCGPAQGYNPEAERALEFLGHDDDDGEIVELISRGLGKNRLFADIVAIVAIVGVEAERWAAENKATIRRRKATKPRAKK